ncbi:hypothetical protein T492DRAFT_1138564 [Pavlovales sp. CCMP2436]|nr:hypothetical protein T492DRAFT_1138564 [Pavlovales sp. CCMP2436]
MWGRGKLRAATCVALFVAVLAGNQQIMGQSLSSRTVPTIIGSARSANGTIVLCGDCTCPKGLEVKPQQTSGYIKKLIRAAGCQARFNMLQASHRPLPESRRMAEVAIVSFMREPLSETVSGYLHGLHDCPRMIRQAARKHDPWAAKSKFTPEALQRLFVNTDPVAVLEYSDCVSAEEQVSQAVQRLQNELAFVGITLSWDESVSAMWTYFGARVPLTAMYLSNVRKQRSEQDAVRARVESILSNYTFIDTPVYHATKAQLEVHRAACGSHGVGNSPVPKGSVKPIRK